MSGREALAIVVAIAAAGACAGSGASEGGPSALPSARRDDLVTIRAHNQVAHIAVGERMVFAATQSGVITYDALFRGWLRPMPLEDGSRRDPAILAADPTEDAVWIGSVGRVVYYRPRLEYAVTVTVAGIPQEIFFDRRDLGAGAYVRTGTSIMRISRAGGTTFVPPGGAPGAGERLEAPSTREVLRAYPTLETFFPLLARDDDLEQWRVTAAAAAPARSEVWLGTYGNGLLKVDPTFNRAEQLPFGLVEPGVGALAPAADGVWAGGRGAPGHRGALVFASSDLQRWRWLDGPRSRPLVGTRVTAIATQGGQAWIGTNRGLLRMDLHDDSRFEQWDAGDGLPSDVVTSVVAWPSGVWVGTPAGLAHVDRGVRPAGPRMHVHGLAMWGDTLWIASNIGLLAMAPADSSPRRLDLDDGRLSRPIVAVTRTDSVLVAASEDDVLEIDVGARRVLPPRAASISALREITRVAADAHTIWVSGEGGVVVIHRVTGRSTFLAAGTVLPAQATDVVLTPELAWVATRDGLVRVRRRSDGMPP
ncbi:MAG: hypothetical protein ACT4PJ_09805 [Gemmatimonadaceae bacterium]